MLVNQGEPSATRLQYKTKQSRRCTQETGCQSAAALDSTCEAKFAKQGQESLRPSRLQYWTELKELDKADEYSTWVLGLSHNVCSPLDPWPCRT